MPRIVRLYAFGGPENLIIEEAPSQQPGPGEARLRVEAAGLNRDAFTFMTGHNFVGYGFVEPNLPSRIGYEVAGVVDAVGAGVDSSLIGKHVATLPGFDQNRYGTLGEEAVVPAGFLHEYPSNLSSSQAAALWMPYLTAYGALVTAAQIRAGDVVSIPVATSSVGLAAIQFVRDVGATSIALTRTPSKKEGLLSHGADHVIVTSEENYTKRVLEITGNKGVRVTLDPIGGQFIEQIADVTAPGGIIIEYGRLSGQPTPFPIMPAFGKGLWIRGYTLRENFDDPQTTIKATQYISDRVSRGRFVPTVWKTYPLEQLVDAYQCVESDQQVGRIVITL